jgi:hypothetical protein
MIGDKKFESTSHITQVLEKSMWFYNDTIY